MAIHAHPNDGSSKGAAAMARYTAEGHRVKVMVCADGEVGNIPNPVMGRSEVWENIAAMRVHETIAVVEVPGVEHEWLGFTDPGLPAGNPVPMLLYGVFARQSVEGATKPFIRVIRELHPYAAAIYNENGGYPHPDHTMTHIMPMRTWLEPGMDKYPELGEPWEIPKLYRAHGSIKVRLIVLDSYYYDNSLESSLAEPFRRWTRISDDITTRVTAQAEYDDYFQQRDQALLTHATQIDPNGPFSAVLVDAQQCVWSTEKFELVRTRAQTELPETDSFADINSDVKQSGINARLELMTKSFDVLAAHTTIFLAQNPTGPRGADFGRASPVGLLIIVVLLIVVLVLGWDLSCCAKCLAVRQKFIEAHGMNPFDFEAVDKMMAAAEQCCEAR